MQETTSESSLLESTALTLLANVREQIVSPISSVLALICTIIKTLEPSPVKPEALMLVPGYATQFCKQIHLPNESLRI